jgi:hypothetical protein
MASPTVSSVQLPELLEDEEFRNVESESLWFSAAARCRAIDRVMREGVTEPAVLAEADGREGVSALRRQGETEGMLDSVGVQRGKWTGVYHGKEA